MRGTIDLLPLLIPAATAMLALPFGLRARTGEANVRAVYLFHRSGDPLATVASDYGMPFEAGQLEPVLTAVRTLLESSEPRGRSPHETRRQFGEEGLVAIRGRYVSAFAVFRGGSDGSLRRDLGRFVQEFESTHDEHLDTWEQAVHLAGAASSAISRILAGVAPPSSPGAAQRDSSQKDSAGRAVSSLVVPSA